MQNMSLSHLAYELKDPEVLRSPIVFASPHSGREYSKEFLQSSVLDARVIRSSEDAYVDQLIDFIPEMGAPLLLAKVPRAYVDLNRAADELDPSLINDVHSRAQNPRITSGLGVIPRVVSNARAIYRGKLSKPEALARIDQYWFPYHRALQRLLSRAHACFGYSLLIDMHSMPHEAVAHLGKPNQGIDVVLGDRYGASADIALGDLIEQAFETHKFRVSRNVPFAGAYITQRYGQPGQSKHVVQVELDRALYLDEVEVAPSERFEELKDCLKSVLGYVIEETAQPPENRLAAE